MNHTIARLHPFAVSTLVSILACAASGEVVVRVFSLAPALQTSSEYAADPLTGYKPRPLSVVTVRTDEFTYVRRHNSAGFRDTEHTVAKPPGVFRILGLGDSFTYGVGVNPEQTYLHRLEAMLNARAGAHPRVEIINAGVPGFFPEPERTVLQHYGMQYAPDLVLVAFVPNDVVDTYKGLGALAPDESGYLITREARQLGPRTRWFIRQSHLARLIVSRYLQHRIKRAERDRSDELYAQGGFHEPDWMSIEAEYAQMVAMADRGHARLVLAHIPQRGPWEQRHEYPATRLSRWSRQHGVLFADVLPEMIAASSNRKLYYTRDGHCTAEGHEVIAESIFKILTAAGYVP